jgi:trimethylamine--corrinoid protein Co-methyltransferase
MRASLQVLSQEERAAVHERTLHMLAEVGMRVDTAHGRRILAEAGALVDEETRVARFPAELVEESLRLAPRQFSLGARRPGWSFPLNAGESTLVMDGEGTMVLDRVTEELRPSTHRDWLEATRLIDAVDDIGVYWAMVEGAVTGETPADWVAYNIELARNFSKHVQDSFSDPAGAPWVLEVLAVVFGSREEVRRRHPYSFLITPVSPLVIEERYTDTWLALRGWDIPVAVMPMPMMGSTAPGSLLATTLLANCETLGLLCLVQAAEPGTPFIYAPVAAAMEPRSGRYAGGHALAALSAAGTEMARFYGLPALGSGCGSDQFVPGIQAAYEKAFDLLVGSLAWPDLMVGPGGLGGSLVISLEQVLMDVEVFRMCRKAHEGIAVAENHWLDDVVARVGPGGNFIAERSTRDNLRNGEWFLPGLGMHDSYERWLSAGRPELLDEVRAGVEDLLAGHEPLPLPEDVERELERLRARAAGS